MEEFKGGQREAEVTGTTIDITEPYEDEAKGLSLIDVLTKDGKYLGTLVFHPSEKNPKIGNWKIIDNCTLPDTISLTNDEAEKVKIANNAKLRQLEEGARLAQRYYHTPGEGFQYTPRY